MGRTKVGLSMKKMRSIISCDFFFNSPWLVWPARAGLPRSLTCYILSDIVIAALRSVYGDMIFLWCSLMTFVVSWGGIRFLTCWVFRDVSLAFPDMSDVSRHVLFFKTFPEFPDMSSVSRHVRRFFLVCLLCFLIWCFLTWPVIRDMSAVS